MPASLWLASILERVDIEIYESTAYRWVVWVWEAMTEFQNTMYC